MTKHKPLWHNHRWKKLLQARKEFSVAGQSFNSVNQLKAYNFQSHSRTHTYKHTVSTAILPVNLGESVAPVT